MRKTILIINLLLISGIAAGQTEIEEVQGLNDVDLEIQPVAPASEEVPDHAAVDPIDTEETDVEEFGVRVEGTITLSDMGVEHSIQTESENHSTEIEINLTESEDEMAGMAIVEEDVEITQETPPGAHRVGIDVVGQQGQTFSINEDVEIPEANVTDEDQVEAQDEQPDPEEMTREELEEEVRNLREQVSSLQETVSDLQDQVGDEEEPGVEPEPSNETDDPQPDLPDDAQEDSPGDEAEGEPEGEPRGFVERLTGLF